MRKQLSIRWIGVAAAVFALAFAARLVPVLRGGGLTGQIGYDGGVYYGAAVALVHGAWPYRDFLLLHPPGITVALAPFAEIGRVTNELTGLAVARVVWMLMGSITAVLVTRILKPVGLLAALVGGVCYAVFPFAVMVERAPLLEGFANLLLAAALLLISPVTISRATTRRAFVAALTSGVLLGFGSSVKIWGVVPLVLVVVYVLFQGKVKAALAVLGGALAGAAVICGPFFLAAPGAMWRMVVLDQLGRPHTGLALLTRLNLMTTLGLGHGSLASLAVVVACAGILVACLVAWTQPTLRASVLVLLGVDAMLLVMPSFFAHYAAAAAVPLAIVVGAAVGIVAARVRVRQLAPALALAIAATVIAVDGRSLLALNLAQPMATASIGAATQRVRGCVTVDDPNTLIQLNLLGRDIDRHCEVVLDLGGYSYDLARGSGLTRAHVVSWQQFALGYLRTGDLSIITRFHRGFGFSPTTSTTIHRWPIKAQSGKILARQPSPRSLPQSTLGRFRWSIRPRSRLHAG